VHFSARLGYRMPGNSDILQYEALGLTVRIGVDDPYLIQPVATAFAAFVATGQATVATPIEISVTTAPSQSGWSVSGEQLTMHCEDLSGLLYCLDKVFSIALQLRRQELYFLHAAVLCLDGKAVVISGASGAGKSTLAWHLCNSGFTYLSDELAPIDVSTLEIHAYPRALCLKQLTSRLAEPPDCALYAEHTIHIPADILLAETVRKPAQLESIVFLTGNGGSSPPVLSEISESTAAAMLYSHGLNQLSHARDGLDAVTRIAARVRGYCLTRGNPDAMQIEILKALGGAACGDVSVTRRQGATAG
jgi:hypothetical protein